MARRSSTIEISWGVRWLIIVTGLVLVAAGVLTGDNLFIGAATPLLTLGIAAQARVTKKLDVRFRLIPIPDQEHPELRTFVDVEEKTGTDVGVWINLNPIVAGEKLGERYSGGGGHYNGQRRWDTKKWATWNWTRFHIAHILQEAEPSLTIEEATKMFNNAQTPQERETVLALTIEVEYVELEYSKGECREIGKRQSNIPEYHHFNFNDLVWVAEPSARRIP